MRSQRFNAWWKHFQRGKHWLATNSFYRKRNITFLELEVLIRKLFSLVMKVVNQFTMCHSFGDFVLPGAKSISMKVRFHDSAETISSHMKQTYFHNSRRCSFWLPMLFLPHQNLLSSLQHLLKHFPKMLSFFLPLAAYIEHFIKKGHSSSVKLSNNSTDYAATRRVKTSYNDCCGEKCPLMARFLYLYNTSIIAWDYLALVL